MSTVIHLCAYRSSNVLFQKLFHRETVRVQVRFSFGMVTVRKRTRCVHAQDTVRYGLKGKVARFSRFYRCAFWSSTDSSISAFSVVYSKSQATSRELDKRTDLYLLNPRAAKSAFIHPVMCSSSSSSSRLWNSIPLAIATKRLEFSGG